MTDTTTPTLSDEERELMKHALGRDYPDKSRDFRNHFSADADGPDCAIWRGLVERGLATERARVSWSPLITFHVSDAGKAALDVVEPPAPERWFHALEFDDETSCECWSEEGYVTKDAAIAAAPACLRLVSGDRFWVGRLREGTMDVDFPYTAEDLVDEARSHIPGDHGDAFEPTEEQMAELFDRMQWVWAEWLHKHDLAPAPGYFVDVEAIVAFVATEAPSDG